MKPAVACALLAVLVLPAMAALESSSAFAALGDCGQPQSTGTAPKTSDALATLKSAVGAPSACDDEPCVCDVNASGGINTSDALAILRVAVGQQVALSCDCGCTMLGASTLTAAGAHLDAPAKQIQVEVKVVELSDAAADELGFDWLTNVVQSTPAPGGTSGYDTDVAVSSNATGGPSNVPYFLYSAHRPEGALPILNENFASPFGSIKTLFTLPTSGCVTFAENAVSIPEDHPGGDPVENVPADDGGYDDVESVAHSFLTSQQVTTLLTSLQMKAGTEIFSAPSVRVYPRQSVFHMIDDVEPDIGDFTPAFQSRIQDVTTMPFGNFTGPVLDIEPDISGDSTYVRLRLGTQLATFYFSTAFQVEGKPTDAEIPLHKRSTTSAAFVVAEGQTLLVGGLKRTGSASIEKGLPWIGDLPLVGSLFTHKRVDPAHKLLVFVTPTIVDAP